MGQPFTAAGGEHLDRADVERGALGGALASTGRPDERDERVEAGVAADQRRQKGVRRDDREHPHEADAEQRPGADHPCAGEGQQVFEDGPLLPEPADVGRRGGRCCVRHDVQSASWLAVRWRLSLVQRLPVGFIERRRLRARHDAPLDQLGVLRLDGQVPHHPDDLPPAVVVTLLRPPAGLELDVEPGGDDVRVSLTTPRLGGADSGRPLHLLGCGLPLRAAVQRQVDGAGMCDDGTCPVLVVAGRQAAPVLQPVEGAFDDVAALVVLSVEVDRSATARASPLAVADLVGGLGDHRGDASGAQHRAGRA